MKIVLRSVVLLTAIASVAAAQRAPVKLPSRPEIPAAKSYTFPNVTLDSLPNGLRFAVVENHELPLVVVESAVAGVGLVGSSFLDTPERAGAWGLMLANLREATPTRSTAQITDEALDLGADLRFPTATAFTPPWFRAARSTWKPALSIMADVMMNPTFPEAGFTRVKGVVSTALDRVPPATVANRILFGRLYGGEGPYSQFATSATIAPVTRDDIVALHQKYLRPQNTVIVIAGDVTTAEAREAMKAAFGAWQRGGTTITPMTPSAPTTPAPTTIYLKDVAGLPQSLIVTGMLMPSRDAADAAAIDAMATVLGDFTVSSGSRIYQAFRTERGLSYSASVQPIARPIPEKGILMARAVVTTALTDTAVTTMMKVFRDLRQEKPVTASELDFSKRTILGGLPAAMERVETVADTVLASIRDRLPANYLNERVQRIGSVGLSEVQAASMKYLDADHLIIVVVGDKSKVEAPLRATGIPVVIVP